MELTDTAEIIGFDKAINEVQNLLMQKATTAINNKNVTEAKLYLELSDEISPMFKEVK